MRPHWQTESSERSAPEPPAEDEDQQEQGPTFNPTGPPHPEHPDLYRYIQFNGYIKSFTVNAMTGELILQVGVPAADKYNAFRLTDFMSFRYLFDVYKAPRKNRRRRNAQPDQSDQSETSLTEESDPDATA